MNSLRDQIAALPVNTVDGKALSIAFIDNFFAKECHENAYILLNENGCIEKMLQYVVLNSVDYFEIFTQSALSGGLDPVKISPNTIMLNKINMNSKLRMRVTFTFVDSSITSIDDLSYKWGNTILFGTKGFVYSYAAMKHYRQYLHEELISELFKPSRILAWIDADNDVEDYMM